MEDIKLIAVYGIFVVIAAVFIWDKISVIKVMVDILNGLQSTSKIQADALENIRRSTENTTIALNIIQNTLAGMSQSMERHDKRAEYMNNDIREVCTKLNDRPCIMHGGSTQTVKEFKP